MVGHNAHKARIAFLLPAIHSLLNSPPLPRGSVGILIISPTRELALQIAKECNSLTSQMSKPLECHTAFGDLYPSALPVLKADFYKHRPRK